MIVQNTWIAAQYIYNITRRIKLWFIIASITIASINIALYPMQKDIKKIIKSEMLQETFVKPCTFATASQHKLSPSGRL